MDKGVGVSILVGLTIASSIYVWEHKYFSKLEKTVLLLCIVFPPAQWLGILGILIYYNYKVKNSPAIVKERNAKTKLETSINNLTDLRNKEILTDEEYNQKVAKIKTEKAQQDIQNSKEYKQLKSLLDSGILTNEEFESKITLVNIAKTITKDYRIVEGFSEGLALAINSDLDYGFVDENEKVVIDFIFEHAENFKNGISNVRYKGSFRKVNKNGEFIQ
ncbi:WG repeat-containing protein [Flavobacterium flavigenum]|uniref:WG repeat-containing protein n=1 Tax=Flavobacterium flavigenum TaxID=3003258 RepID=UPI0022AC343F|nr:WG repeat-containing protein [Flavobacterium flavigenum]